ncbi:hypothetical protein D3C85_501440 [compost metagenome]
MTTKLKKRHEGYLSPFQKVKVKEMASFIRAGENPLRAEVVTSLGSYRFNKDDVRIFHESIKQPFYLIVR